VPDRIVIEITELPIRASADNCPVDRVITSAKRASGPVIAEIAHQRTQFRRAAADGNNMVVSSILQCVRKTPMVNLCQLGLPTCLRSQHMNPGGASRTGSPVTYRGGEREGSLRPGMTIAEATSGNTGIGVAMVVS